MSNFRGKLLQMQLKEGARLHLKQKADLGSRMCHMIMAFFRVKKGSRTKGVLESSSEVKESC